ncbi:MAG: diacylglycerol/polyprenol kinase family protein [Rectinema sp.]
MRIDHIIVPRTETEEGKPQHMFFRSPVEELRIELTRKSLHVLILLCIPLLDIVPALPVVSLVVGMVIYSVSELLRHRGIMVPLIAPITERAARRRDGNRFVLGPVTLALGALFSLLIFDPLQAKVAILALGIGDSFSSLIGKSFGRIPMPFSGGKSVEGTIFCFASVLLAVFLLTGKFVPACLVALTTALVEFWPTKDWDNVIIPLAAGVAASLVL